MHDPREPHLAAHKRILRYVAPLDVLLQVIGFPWQQSWSSKRQYTSSRSSAEAEYHGVVNAATVTLWLRNLLLELHCALHSATIFYCDNVNAVYLSYNPVQNLGTKHIEIGIHFVRDQVAT
ncbi:ribonuclease H-like domain-containing protein [Tanacetum coccineum]